MPQIPLQSAAGKSPAPFALSPLHRCHGWRRFLWPFASRKTALAHAILLALGAMVWALVVLTWLDPDALKWAVAGAIIGGLWLGPYRSRPVGLTITTRAEARHTVGDVKELVARLGYLPTSEIGTAGHVHYRHKFAGWLHGWFYHPENDVDLSRSDRVIELRGPINAIEWVRIRLGRTLAEA